MYERINNLCKQNGITITRLCEKITNSKGNLVTWKKNNIRPEHLMQIAALFNVSIDYLITGQKNAVIDYDDSAGKIRSVKLSKSVKFSEAEWSNLLDGLSDESLIQLRDYTRYLVWKQDQELSD